MNNLQKNKLFVNGVFTKEFDFNNSCYGEKFFKSFIEVERISGCKDVLPVIVSERDFDVSRKVTGVQMSVVGQYRQRNYNDETGKRRSDLYIFAENIFEEKIESVKRNEVMLIGHLCKEPTHRTTPLSEKDIADFILAVNRNTHGKSDYINCISWGRNARYMQNLDVGACIKVKGRVQSREYEKLLESGEYETRTAYEVSVYFMEEMEG